MPINASYEYSNAEKAYLEAKTLDEKIVCLEEMIRHAPAHKGGENLRAELRTRLKKFLEKKEKGKKVGKSSKKGIKKEGFQCVLVGLPNSGKSSLLSKLTNAQPRISDYAFTTMEPEIGTMYYQGIKAQMIDMPSIGAETFDIGILHTADCLLIVVDNVEDLKKIEPFLTKASGKRIIVITKIDLLNDDEKRKFQEKLKSKRIPGIMISTKTGEGLNIIKESIVKNANMIRVYTKEPGKERAPNPVALPPNSTVKDVAENIRKGFSLQVKESRITGPSSKFANQKVGLSHILKDQDTVEFHTR